jgi:para-nitrobenzyl esterase
LRQQNNGWEGVLLKRSIQVLAFAAALTGAPPAFAQAPPNPAEAAAALIVITMIPPANSAPLKVSSPAFKDGGDIPFENTQYRGNVFPGLQWSKGPAGTKSYAVIMQDADGVAKGDAILHWTMYDIGPDTRMLAPGMSAPPPGAMAGPNIRGPNMAYMGPKTPAGPKHRYHLQVFALDTVLPPDPTLTWAGLKAALAGHVLASGQTIGLGQVDPTAPAPKPQ